MKYFIFSKLWALKLILVEFLNVFLSVSVSVYEPKSYHCLASFLLNKMVLTFLDCLNYSVNGVLFEFKNKFSAVVMGVVHSSRIS